MTPPGRDVHGARLCPQRLRKLEPTWECRRRIEDPRMRDDAKEAGEDEIGDAERTVRGDRRGKPLAVALVLGRVLAECVDEDIDVDQDQRSPDSIRPSSAAVSSRSTPG